MARKVSAFMDFTKVQTDILKYHDTNRHRYEYGEMTLNGVESVVIFIDGIMAVFIPKCMYYLDNTKIFGDKTPISTHVVDNITKGLNEAEPVTRTRQLIQTHDGKSTFAIFDNGKEDKIYVNSKLLDVFKTGVDINYKGTAYNHPVYVMSNTDLIGVVLPVNMKKGRL